jgi:hypothetical protein
VWDQQVWRTFTGIADRRETLRESFFVTWVGELYYRCVDMTVRAMRDPDGRSDSLRNLLDAVSNRASRIRCPIPEIRLAGAMTLDPAAVAADVEALEKAVAEVPDEDLARPGTTFRSTTPRRCGSCLPP